MDFGPHLYCIARSPRAVLAWDSGHPYTSGRQTCYAESHMLALPDRTGRFQHHPTWKYIGPHGGRLSRFPFQSFIREINETFSDLGHELFNAVWTAARQNSTLLIEGGGPTLRPARKCGRAAHDAWMAEPNVGFINPELKP